MKQKGNNKLMTGFILSIIVIIMLSLKTNLIYLKYLLIERILNFFFLYFKLIIIYIYIDIRRK